MKIVIAGGEGFIGQNLKNHLKQYDVVSLDLKQSADLICNLQESWPFVGRNVGAVICAASEPNIWGSLTPPDVEHEERIVREGMRFCERYGVTKFVHLSSSNVYSDDVSEIPFKDEVAVSPANRYGKQKVLAERELRKQTYAYGVGVEMSAVSLRLFNVIGHAQRKTMFPYIVAENLFKGVPIPVYGERWRSWTPVNEVCIFVHEVLKNMTPGYDVFNYGRTQMWTQHKLIKLFEQRLNVTDYQVNAVILDLEERKEEMAASQPSMEKTCKKFEDAWEQRYPMQFSVDDVINTVAADLGIVLQSD
jgi:nucleoside-diphosphate-sugar epimerase